MDPTMERGPIDPRPWIVMLAVPLISLGSSLAYYGMRSHWITFVNAELGVDLDTAFSAYAWSSDLMIAGVLLGGVLAALVGGWGAAMAGLSIMAISMFILPWASVDGHVITLGWPLWLASIGRMMGTIGLLAALGDGLRGKRAWLLMTGAALSAGALNLGAFSSSQLTWLQLSGFTVIPSMGLVAGAAACLAVLAGVAWLLLGRRMPEPDPRRNTWNFGTFGGAAALALFAGWAVSSQYHTYPLLFQLGDSILGGVGAALNWSQLNPAIVIAGSGLMAVAGIVLYAMRVRVLAFPLIPVGLALGVVGLLVPLLAPTPATEHVLGGIAIVSVGEALLFPAVVLCIGRDLHWRLLPLVLIVWRLAMLGADAIFMRFEVLDATQQPGWGAWWPLVGLLGGAVSVALVGVLRWVLTPRPTLSPPG